MTTYLDAAYHILHQAGQPLRYEDITERALAQQLISPQGLTPEATMASRLYIDTLQEGSRFTRAGKGAFGLVDWRPAGIEAQVQKINQATRDHLRDNLHAMPPDRFEALIGELLIQMGFDERTVEVTKRSGDGGIDVMGVYRAAGLTEVNAAVQVKRWKGNVQAPTVTSLRGSLQVYQQGIIITTSDFSKGAREEAAAPNKTRIGLLNGQDLLELLIRHKVGVVEKALKVISLDEEWWGELAGPAAAAAAAAAEPGPVAVKVSDGSAAGSGKGRAAPQKPASLTFLGQSYPVVSWPQLLVTLCQVMAERHPDDFAERALTVRGPRRQHITADADGMISPVPIGVAGLWLEANQSSTSAQHVAELILKTFGHGDEDLQIVIQQQPG
jgi:restriction system protein